jgi:hypothetical protein
MHFVSEASGIWPDCGRPCNLSTFISQSRNIVQTLGICCASLPRAVPTWVMTRANPHYDHFDHLRNIVVGILFQRDSLAETFHSCSKPGSPAVPTSESTAGALLVRSAITQDLPLCTALDVSIHILKRNYL